MEKLAYFFIDDTIWTLRDVARQRPDSIFENAFLKMLKTAHDKYGLTVQMNLFYRTDFFYGSDEWTLSEMPDCYKAEFEANVDWLRFAFHAKQEFPDYPYPNARYEDLYADYKLIHGEVKRFAGEACWSDSFVMHWGAVSKEGCKALKDCGVRLLSPSVGEKHEYTGDPTCLPYGHAARLLQNRHPETALFTRNSANKAISSSIASHNFVKRQVFDEKLFGRNASILDEETGLRYRTFSGGPCLNLYDQDGIREKLTALNGNEFIGVAVHEQYFYPDYYAYIPDYAERVYLMAQLLHDFGYRFITTDEMK